MKSLKRIILFLFFFLVLTQFNEVFSQDNNSLEADEELVSKSDQLIIFLISIIVVIGIFVYIARHVILRKKTEYDKKELESKKDRTYEKYHSDWTSDDYEFEKKLTDDDFSKELRKKNLPNYYQVLGISKTASKNEIKSKFRKLVKEWHPDKSKQNESEKKMAEINKAYEILSDDEKRKIYDSFFDGK